MTSRRRDLIVTGVGAAYARTRYDDFSIALHWLTVALVLTLFVLAETWDLAPHRVNELMKAVHMSFGILLTAVLLVRIVWRFIPGHQVRPAAAGLVELAARSVQYLFYGLLVIQVTLGIVVRWTENESLSFFGLQIASPFPHVSRPVHDIYHEAHGYIAWAIIIVAAGHASAALYHRFVLHDDVLQRMLPEDHTETKE